MTPLESLINDNEPPSFELKDEIETIRVIGEAFDKMNEEARKRIIFWLFDRYKISWSCDHCECECEECMECG